MSTAKQQIITENYAIYNSDCVEVLKSLPDNSIDLSIYSPPLQVCTSIRAIRATSQTAKTKSSFTALRVFGSGKSSRYKAGQNHGGPLY